MREDEARALELVRAVEIEDGEGTLLTREDRAQAEAAARQAVGRATGKKAERTFLASRSLFAAGRLATRHPGLARLLDRTRWPRWIVIVLPLAAFAIGLLANELGQGRRLDLLAVPLLGTIAWNLLVYASLPFSALRGRGARSGDPVARLVARAAGLGPRNFDRGTPLHRAADTFQQRWSALAAPLYARRIGATLHLSAALFAAGVIAGIYLRALVVEYRAGWESTFLSPFAVRELLALVLGPASALTGVAIPPAADIAALRWSAGNGMIAGPWIHLWTVTLAGAVILPRLLLAAWQGLSAARLARNLPVAGREDFYTRRLLRAAEGGAGRLRVTPYAYTPERAVTSSLAAALTRALGERTEIVFDEPVLYGEEDSWLEANPPDPATDFRVLLFSASATPEDENHGSFATQLAKAVHAGTSLSAVVDESPFRARFAGQAGFEERLSGRVDAWRSVLDRAGLPVLFANLADASTQSLAERLEGNLMAGPEMRR